MTSFRKHLHVPLAAMALLVSLLGCYGTIEQKVVLPPGLVASASPTPDPEVTAIIQVIHDNANALNGGDPDKFKASFHADSEFTKLLPDFYVRLRETFRTRYNIVETKLQSQSADIASVIVKRRTTDYTGTIEQDVLYTIRKSQGNWLIFAMDIQAARSLN